MLAHGPWFQLLGLCRFFLQPLDLLQMIRPVFRHHPNIVANSDWVIEFRMTGGFQQVNAFQPSQQPHIGVAVWSIERDQFRAKGAARK